MKAVDILNKHNLKRTACREGIIEVVMTARQAFSEHEIRERLIGNFDRTTFYRSFKTLEEHKIIHKIVVDNQMVKYALVDKEQLNGEHAHFYCNNCNMVKCIGNIPMQEYQLPDEYSCFETEVLIKGICANCKNTENN